MNEWMNKPLLWATQKQNQKSQTTMNNKEIHINRKDSYKLRQEGRAEDAEIEWDPWINKNLLGGSMIKIHCTGQSEFE